MKFHSKWHKVAINIQFLLDSLATGASFNHQILLTLFDFFRQICACQAEECMKKNLSLPVCVLLSSLFLSRSNGASASTWLLCQIYVLCSLLTYARAPSSGDVGARAQVLVVLWAREVLDYNTALGLRVLPSSQFKQHLSFQEYFYAFAPIFYQCLWSSPVLCLLNVLLFAAKITALRITSFKY